MNTDLIEEGEETPVPPRRPEPAGGSERIRLWALL